MFIRLTIGFIIASLIQAAIVMIGENLNITSLDVNLDFLQLVTHIITGIVAGYILYFIIINTEKLENANLYLVGVIYGIILWPIVLGIASLQGKVNNPLNMDAITIIWTMTAFAVYGIIANYTIQKVVHND